MSEFVNTVEVVGDEALTSSIVDRSITEIADDTVTNVGQYAFNNCKKLASANFPAVTIIEKRAFYYCSALTTADFPLVTSIGESAFYYCFALTTADFPLVTSMSNYAFRNCSRLKALILRKTDAICTIGNTNVFVGTPIDSGTGYIYVPANLKSQYEQASNWSNFAARFRDLESFTVDGTTTGALDETKI